MDTKDILLYESGDGGEMAILSNDLVLSEEILQQAYLALFGGNVEANTTGDELANEVRFYWWGNSLFSADDTTQQWNSNTERALNEIIMNSAGRQEIIRAVTDDLQYLDSVVNMAVDVQFENLNRIKIIINFESKTNQEDKTLQMVYDNAKQELIIDQII